MKILQQAQICVGDSSSSQHVTALVYTDEDRILYARTSMPLNQIADSLSELNGIPIPKERIFPKVHEADFTWATTAALKDCYMKYPDLLSYEDEKDSKTGSWKELMLLEVQVCEALKKHPHPNVAVYLGCVKEVPYVTALCFAKYKRSLWEKVVIDEDPKFKEAEHVERVVEGVRKGIEHIHSLGYCHNDINPSNIMFGDDDHTPVIIDFDACLPEGEKLGIKKGTEKFRDEGAKFSSRTNDFYSLKRTEEFILDEVSTWNGGIDRQ